MSLRYKLQKVKRIYKQLTSKEREKLDQICTAIQMAQRQLNRAAREKLAGCKKDCQGLCCKNVIPDDLITLADVLYIWTKSPWIREPMKQRIRRESLFTADCFFLKDGVGPCIFALDVRPEKCLNTFCGDTTSINKEIRSLRKRITRLERFLVLSRVGYWLRKVSDSAHP